jgi:hypothetical protein
VSEQVKERQGPWGIGAATHGIPQIAQAEHKAMKLKAHRKDAGRIIWSLMAELQQANIETKQTKAVIGWLQRDTEME